MTDFDEEWYLQQNLDVARSVAEGGWKSGREHYETHGKSEGRYGAPGQAMAEQIAAHKGAGYLVPSDLSASSVRLKRIALHGSCLLQDWGFQHANPSNATVDIYLNNFGGVPARSDEEIAAYDLQVIQIAFRNIFSDGQIWRVGHDDDLGLQAAFEDSCARLEVFLMEKMAWNTQCGLLTLVVNFMVPQQNPMGRLFPRYHLSNVQYFFEQLNARLETILRRYKNAYILDIDNLSASLGRRYIQDDSIALFAHEAMIPNIPATSERIEPLLALSDYYHLGVRQDIHDMIWVEMEAMYRTAIQTNPVKMVIVDLDDTLWHGISADWTDIAGSPAEGWPIGFVEALMYLKKRGILLAIISKNDEAHIRAIWHKVFEDRLRLDDFVAIKINWTPKPENMAEILEGVNLLPRNVVFIDDNPVERAAMKSAFPDMRILGRHPYYLRRILLWSSETQVVSITEESGKRTEMVKAQLERENARKTISREDFLQSAAPSVKMLQIAVVDHPRFPRCFELINRTNQFNTTGRRWRLEELESLFRDGGRLYTFEVTDSFTSYGLVGVVIVRGAQIEQWVMSCRVLGYNIEAAVMAAIVEDMRGQGVGEIGATLIETDANFPARDLFAKCGFSETAKGLWQLRRSAAPAPAPAHVRLYGYL